MWVACPFLLIPTRMSEVVIITGASSGLGLATALHMHKNGYVVFGTSRNPEKYEKQFPFPFLFLENADPVSIQSCVESVLNQTGRLDILINNAGVGITGPMEEIDLTDVKDHFEINCFGPMRMIQAVLPQMRKQKKGLIINITSIAADMGLPFRGAYSAAKVALERMSESIRLESHSFGIRICNLAPGDFVSNIAQRRHYAPLDKESPYFEMYKFSLDQINEHVDKGIDPNHIVRTIEEIIKTKKPKVRYKVGAPLQKLSGVLKTLLPSRIFEKLLMNHYKL
jgi:NAD(P)-dependent dehydrogenase (short-subunit alcohol dehydrogenase family)